MLENVPPAANGETDNGLRQSPMFDPMIDRILKDFEDSLDGHDRAEFRELRDRGLQIDRACWDMAQNTESSAKAVNLKALHAVRGMDVASATLLPDEGWRYDIGLCGDGSDGGFWQRVDDCIEVYLRKYGELPIHGLKDTETLLHADRETSSRPGERGVFRRDQPIASMHERDIVRRSLRSADGSPPHHVTYFLVVGLPKLER